MFLQSGVAVTAVLSAFGLLGAVTGFTSPLTETGLTIQDWMHGNRHGLRLKGPQRIPGKCVCTGEIGPEARFNETGPRPDELLEGVDCIAADFDGNGWVDYAIPGAEGIANIILNGPDGSWKVVRIDVAGMLELYPSRGEAGDHGEPVAKNPGLLVRWVGQHHAVFVWRGDTFVRLLFPAQ